MEKPIFPCEYMRITQGYNEGTHKDSYAIDNAGKDTGISDIYAPFTGIIKKIYKNDANEIWLESIDKVEYPDTTIDYMTVMFAHDNNVDDLFVGKKINQGDVFYQEGTKGNASGNHCHIECGKGKFSGTGWHKNSNGYWSINNSKKPEECLWITENIKILNDYGYNFKTISTKLVEKEENIVNIPVQKEEKIKLEFIAPTKDLYGVYLNENEKIIIKELSK